MLAYSLIFSCSHLYSQKLMTKYFWDKQIDEVKGSLKWTPREVAIMLKDTLTPMSLISSGLWGNQSCSVFLRTMIGHSLVGRICPRTMPPTR